MQAPKPFGSLRSLGTFPKQLRFSKTTGLPPQIKMVWWRTNRRRFECFPEPSGGWLVWDNDADEPVMVSGVVMSGISPHQAFFVTEILNGLRCPSNLALCPQRDPALICISTPKQTGQ
jgi:hypothetical protein